MTPREPRRKVFVKARIRIGGSWGDVCVRDISSRGLLLQGREAPPRGTYLEVRRGRHVVIARVVWTGEQRFGVQAQDKISVESFVADPDLSSMDFKSVSAFQPGFERRSSPRGVEAGIIQKAEQSRRISSFMEFAVVVGLGVLAATVAFDVVGQTLSGPLETLSSTFQTSVDGP